MLDATVVGGGLWIFGQCCPELHFSLQKAVWPFWFSRINCRFLRQWRRRVSEIPSEILVVEPLTARGCSSLSASVKNDPKKKAGAKVTPPVHSCKWPSGFQPWWMLVHPGVSAGVEVALLQLLNLLYLSCSEQGWQWSLRDYFLCRLPSVIAACCHRWLFFITDSTHLKGVSGWGQDLCL